VAPPSSLEIVADANDGFSESPVWVAEEQALLWVGGGGVLRRLDGGSHVAEAFHPPGEPASAVAALRPGSYVLAQGNALNVYTPTRGDLRTLAVCTGVDPPLRLNDGSVDARGRLWIGTTNVNAGPIITGPQGHSDGVGSAKALACGALYRLARDGELRVLADGIAVSNGIGWSPDSTLMFYVDSMRRRVDVFDFDLELGRLANRRLFVAIDRDDGWPDGLAVDSLGHVWVALFGGGVVRRFAPDGTHERDVELPVRQVTNCCFGGADLTDLFVTTAGVAAEAGVRHAGAIFRFSAPAPGLMSFPYRP
jgi:sugar lactone lactonase YvrE